MAEELTKEEKARLKEERRKAFLAAHPELAAKQKEAEAKKNEAKKKLDNIKDTVETVVMNDQQQARMDKMNQLREMGIDPFGQGYDQTHHAAEIFAQYQDASIEELDAANHEVSIAGRIMYKRRMGKLGFIHLLDRSGKIQVVINQRIV